MSKPTTIRLEEEVKLWKWLGAKLLDGGCQTATTAIDDFEGFKKVVRNALFDEVEQLVESTGQKIPPVNPELVAKERKVVGIERDPLDTDALIVPCRGGFLMKINEKLPVVRKRFACAHEIAHTYFFDIEKDPPHKPYKRSTSRYGVEEGLCYESARRILMPTRMMRTWMDNATPPYIKEFGVMMRSFLVSGEVLTYRIHDLAKWKVLMLIFDSKSDGGLSLYKVVKSGDVNDVHVARRGLEVRDPMLHELLSRAFNGEVVEEKEITIAIGNFKGKIASFGAAYMGSYPPKVVAILCL